MANVMKRQLLKPLFLLAAIALGITYLLLIDTRIEEASVTSANGIKRSVSLPYEAHSAKNSEMFTFEVTIVSKIDQRKKLHITADDELLDLAVNGEPISFTAIKEQYRQTKLKDYQRGYNFVVPLQRGSNTLVIKTKNYKKGNYTLKVAQGYFYRDFILFCFLILLPMIILAVDAVHLSIPHLSQRVKRYRDVDVQSFLDRLVSYLPWIIIASGIVLRLLYFVVYGHSSYQHDQYYHIEFVKYFAHHWSLPLPDKALEFPQQPLYYFLSGKVMALLLLMGFGENDILRFIAALSTVMMSAVLVIAYQVLKLLTPSRFIVNTALAFLAFTPSLLFLSAQINNDPLNYFLAASALFYIVRFERTRHSADFGFALLFSVLVFLTKVSSGMVAILLFVVLLKQYFEEGIMPDQKQRVIFQIKAFSAVIAGFLIFSMLRVYLPSTGEFLFVNSGVFKGQEIHTLDISYFFSFNIFALINEGQAYVYDKTYIPVKQSFLTWQYATMLLGEYDYKRVMDTLALNRLVYFFGLVYVAGILSFVYYIRSMPFLVKMFAMIILVNVLLIVNFALNYPSVCNTDFRYNSPTILLWGIIMAFGLHQLAGKMQRWRRTIIAAVTLAAVSEVVWIVYLLSVGRQNSIS